MKKFFTFVLVCCLVFSSSSIAFATATQWDTSDRQLLSNISYTLTSNSTGTTYRLLNSILNALTSSTQQGSLYNGVAYLYDIREALTSDNTGVGSTLSNINTNIGNIWSALSFAIDGQYISVFVARIMTAVEGLDVDLSTIVSKLTSINTQTTNTAANTAGIYSLINGYDNVLIDNVPKIEDLSKALTNYYYSYGAGRITASEFARNGHTGLLTYNSELGNYSLTYAFPFINSIGNKDNLYTTWSYGSPLGNFMWMFKTFATGFMNESDFRNKTDVAGYNSTQTFTKWNGSNLTTSTFTPTSAINGIYSWLSDIQTPIARLAFVHASDQEIEARQLAEENQQTVVDDFIDPSGSGSAAPSDFGSVSDLSSGFKDNIVTDASVSGIWNIFNSDNFGWFSQETADQLDTSGSASRSLRSSGSYPTPLLDQQTEDILNYLGGNNND